MYYPGTEEPHRRHSQTTPARSASKGTPPARRASQGTPPARSQQGDDPEALAGVLLLALRAGVRMILAGVIAPSGAYSRNPWELALSISHLPSPADAPFSQPY